MQNLLPSEAFAVAAAVFVLVAACVMMNTSWRERIFSSRKRTYVINRLPVPEAKPSLRLP